MCGGYQISIAYCLFSFYSHEDIIYNFDFHLIAKSLYFIRILLCSKSFADFYMYVMYFLASYENVSNIEPIYILLCQNKKERYLSICIIIHLHLKYK